jgi:Spore Coat Protein U domain
VNDSFAQASRNTRLRELIRRNKNGPDQKIWPMALCGLCLWLTAGLAWAAPSCTITSTAIAFGNYDPLSAIALPGTGTLSFNCTSGVGAGVNIVIALSTGSSGSYVTRTLKSGAPP